MDLCGFTSKLPRFQTRIWYPFMSAEDFRSKLFFSPEDLQQRTNKQDAEADSRFSLVMRHHENVFPRLALVFGAYFEHNEPRYRLSTRLILRMGLPGPLSGDPMLFLLSLVGDGGAGFPICKQTNKQKQCWNQLYR